MDVTEAIVVVAVVLLAVGLVWLWTKKAPNRNRSEELQRKFGPEYERALEEHSSRNSAEHELLRRAKRMERVRIVPLTVQAHDQYLAAWTDTQRQFVDDPAGAVKRADLLITEVMNTRGYPMADFDQRVADLSVDHGNVVQHYRAARTLARQSAVNQASTEDLRQAFVHYRVLFADLLETEPQRASIRQIRKEAHS